jgi:hypothetical protein
LIAYEISCTLCPHRERVTCPREAMARLAADHICVRDTTDDPPGYRCQACSHIVPALVDDGPLCIRCDALHYPA